MIHNQNAVRYGGERLAEYRVPALDMYTGLQHVRLLDGVRYIQDQRTDIAIDISIVSAGYGLIPSNREIVPYECTFNSMKVREIRAWAEHLRLPQDAEIFFANDADFSLVILGQKYLVSLSLTNNVVFNSPTLFFAGQESRRHIRGRGTIRTVIFSRRDTTRFSCGMVGLKGELAKRTLHVLANNFDEGLSLIFDPDIELLDLLAKQSTR